jgi:hypothetical protein
MSEDFGEVVRGRCWQCGGEVVAESHCRYCGSDHTDSVTHCVWEHGQMGLVEGDGANEMIIASVRAAYEEKR